MVSLQAAIGLTKLTVEGRTEPLGLDVTAPRFGWQIVSDKKNVMQPGEPSEKIRERVIAARKIQTDRFSQLPLGGGREGGRIYCNAMMTEKMLHQFAEPDAASIDMLRMAMERLKLSARAYRWPAPSPT